MAIETYTTWVSNHQLLVFSGVLIILIVYGIFTHFADIIEFVEGNRRD